jgi:predicted transcriptional regulator
MAEALTVWLDDETAAALQRLADLEERRRGQMVRVLIRRADREVARGQLLAAPGLSKEVPNKVIPKRK